ncbi:MAG: hypothetical protein F4Y00_05640 [Bacteroidetes bacterium SB0662_bin_6]|nr:hypothetical protein [Bacteroidetes bacterium SB0668_bin_1]MYE04438.1 hypothetical protein [Bacteroidetes bacterium SB0662_bin_6]
MSLRRSPLFPVAGVTLALLLAFASLAVVPEVHAQLFSYGRVAQQRAGELSIIWQAVDFQPDTNRPTEGAPMFTGPAYGIMYARANISATLTYGSESSTAGHNSRLLDVAVATWSSLFTIGASETSRLYLPLTLQTNYRRVAPKGQANSPFGSFQVTVIGLGVGLGGSTERGKNVRLEARAAPALGIALRSFGGSTGMAWLVDAGARMHIREVFKRFGLSAGYGFRTQSWRVGEANLILEPSETRLDYLGSQHMITLGLNW